MVKISKKVIVLIAVVSAVAFVVLLNCFVWFPDALTLPMGENRSNKLDISSVKIDHGFDWLSSNIQLTVTNTYNSPITVIGSRVNGLSFEYSEIEIPPGQTKNVVISLSGLKINNSTSYDTKLTFTFDDGQYEVYSVNLIPPKYVYSFIITGQSMNATSNSTVYSVTIQNTGNIPLVTAKCTLDNFESLQTLSHTLMPKSTATLNFIIPLTPQKGPTYSVILEATFAEGSTFSAETSYIFS